MTEQTPITLAERIFDTDRLSGISTGFAGLDEVVGGLKKGTLIVLAGATGMGKSVLALQVLLNLVKRGIRVGYFDLENGSEVSWERLLRAYYGLTASWFRNPLNLPTANTYIQELSSKVSYYSHEQLEAAFDINYGTGMIFNTISHAHKDTQIWLIDPLQALESNLRASDLLQEQSKIVQKFKELAQSLGKTIILCHHIRKSIHSSSNSVSSLEEVSEVKYRLPTLDDLRGSGKISDFATDVWGMVRMASANTKEKRSNTLLRVLKNRTGSKGDVKLYFNEDTLQFSELPWSFPSTQTDALLSLSGPVDDFFNTPVKEGK